ncbi:hypothetical protein PSEUBRA_001781 [Kalmanozyma brasiliensis GHG001]|uniref:Uncharacterized protein n=1 Tax=Kalmanozyma brasiliensis (strain GHG001) TaxID=1365824 RepID=V5GRZ8_KALBG|nr:uncharacterized protein PSEUBRA_001781 [Kalmanozyma brasiliensis GHG001]EST08702.1 hypothetical protein PSEUBRA_001781 [Kalmanozyma brasiliensis GHG001]
MPSNVRPLTGKKKMIPLGAETRVQTIGRLLTYFSGAFIVFSLLCSLAPASSSRGLAPSNGQRRSTTPSGRCDPFSLPGWVDYSIGTNDLPAWRTFDPSCTSSTYLASLISTLNIQQEDPSKIAPHHEHTPARGASVEELNSFLSNRTVLLIGDQRVDQALVSHFCSLTGHKAQPVDKSHPWGNSLNMVPAKHGFTPVKNNAPLAHYCYVPEYDFLVTSVYSYGADTSDTWRGEALYNAPGLFEDRVTDLFVPYLKAMASSKSTSPALPLPRGKAEPDLVFFNSGLWDLARWAHHDIDTGVGLLENLSEERIMWWRSRMVDMLNSVSGAWRKPRIVWRNTAYPLASEASTVEAFLGIEGERRKNHPLYHANRIAQINGAQRSALEVHGDDVVKGERARSARMPNGVVGLGFAEVMMGQDQHALDPLAPSQLPCGALFGEMMLWHLRDAVNP